MSNQNVAQISPTRTFRNLRALLEQDPAESEVDILAAELAARTAAAAHDFALHKPSNKTCPGLCVDVVAVRGLSRYGRVARVLDDYGVELRFRRMESDESRALVWACLKPDVADVRFVGSSVGERFVMAAA